MNTLGNVIWLIFGGILIAIEYLVSSILLMVTIIGIPFGIQTLKLASLALWPFGREAVQTNRASGCLAVLMNVLWILLGGFWIAVTHLVFALLLAITIIGIPFARQHVKLAVIGLTPFGLEIRNTN
jgi:uncharacterized membrane protein YccF (DUF307 family)